MRKCTFCNILPLLFYQFLRITFQDFNESAPFHRVSSLLPKNKFQLGALRASTKRIAAIAPPTAQVCSGAEKPPRWRSPLPVTQFYCSSNMAVGAGSDSKVSWPHTHLLLITMPTQCLCAAQVRMVLDFHLRALNVTHHPYYSTFFIIIKRPWQLLWLIPPN